MTMTGMDGADTFVVGGEGRIKATITDFQLGVDKLQFDYAGRVYIRQEHGNTVVTAGNDQVVLTGVNSHHVNPHDLLV